MAYNRNRKQISFLAILIFPVFCASVHAFEFYNELLSTSDKDLIDISKFSDKDYILPGMYTLTIKLNSFRVDEEDIRYIERNEDNHIIVEACLTPEQVGKFGLVPEYYDEIRWGADGQCADFSALEAVVLKTNLGTSSLDISIPRKYLEYSDQTWLPSSRWDDGISGGMLDYNVSSMLTKPVSGSQYQNVSGNGVMGVNAGPWRGRAEWQASYLHTTGNRYKSRQNFSWNQIYAYRALRRMAATMTVGEDFVSSDIFDAWRFAGISIVSDDKMLPPQMRGFSPEVTGIARTNAHVIISQKGHVVYETSVPSGTFRIQEISSALNGVLDVRVEEQDGSVQIFQVDAVTTPFLTRPGQLRYKMTAGRPEDYGRHFHGPAFTTAELSWGINNEWSTYAGTIIAGDYNALALGVGRDLYMLGTASADVTQAFARMDKDNRRQGKAWRVNYSKRFSEYNSELAFVGSRFSEQDYLSMEEFLNDKYSKSRYGHGKALYTTSVIKSFPDLRMSANLSWSHQTYWDRGDRERYSVSVNKFFDAWDMHNLSLTLTATRSEYNMRSDDSVFLSLSMPLGRGTANYSGTSNNGSVVQTLGWIERLENDDTYRLQSGVRNGSGKEAGTLANAWYSHSGDMADVSANASWAQNDYFSAGISLSGGITATHKGVALHPGSGRGNTRLMLSTDGVADVPIERNQQTNSMGIAVVPNIPSYYRHSASINVNKLPDDIEHIGSPVAEAALTDGAIGYRELRVLKGNKAVAIFSLPDGKHPPLGALITNHLGQEIGIVGGDGYSWISGVNGGDSVTVAWGKDSSCQSQIPAMTGITQLLLPCHIAR